MTFFQSIKQKIGIIFLVGLLFGAGAFALLSMRSKSYRAGEDFLIIQNQANTQDYYTLSRSAEYVSKILVEAVRSETFINEATGDGQIGNDILPPAKKNRITEWSKIVRVSRNSDLGIIHVDAFANNQRDALKLAGAVSRVLSEKSNLFLGDSQTISVRLISGPLVESNPSLQTLVGAVVGGFLLGMFLVSMFVYYRSLPVQEESDDALGQQETKSKNYTSRKFSDHSVDETPKVNTQSVTSQAPSNLPFANNTVYDPELERLRKRIIEEDQR